MHVLFAQVLGEKDLSKAGDLFSLEDRDIENDLSEVLRRIRDISDAPEYMTNANNQSVVEICITRVTSSIRYPPKYIYIYVCLCVYICTVRKIST